MGKTTWPGWKCVRLLGTGSFGKVYEIRREYYGREIKAALKVITVPPDDVSLQQIYGEGMGEQNATEYFKELVDSIVAECALMAELRGHSNIVSYEDHMVEERENQFGWEILIRMELLTPLVDWINVRPSPMTETDVIGLGIDMCRALEVCHGMKILHRDIKPENIFFKPPNSYKLGDFGNAKKTAQTLSPNAKKGTYTYMAPEVYFHGSYDETADLYSLGIVLYQFLNGNRTPFLQKGEDKFTDREHALKRRMDGTPIPEPEYGSAMLKETVLKTVAFNKADRYQSARELREALEECLRYCNAHGDTMEKAQASNSGQVVRESTIDILNDPPQPPEPAENRVPPPELTRILLPQFPPTQTVKTDAPEPAEETAQENGAPETPAAAAETPEAAEKAVPAQEQEQKPESKPEAPPPVPDSPAEESKPEPVAEPGAPAKPPASKPKWLLPAAIGGGAVLLLGLIILGISLHSRSKPDTVSSTGAENTSVSDTESRQSESSAAGSSSKAESSSQASASTTSSSSEAKSESSAQQSTADVLKTDDLYGIRLLIFLSGDKASGAAGTVQSNGSKDGLKWELIPEGDKLKDTNYEYEGGEEIRVSPAGVANHYYVDYIRKEPLFADSAKDPMIWVTVDDMSAQIADVSFLNAAGDTVEFELGSEKTEPGSDGAKTFFMVLLRRF